MKINLKFCISLFLTICIIVVCSDKAFSQMSRDTVYVYDTIVVKAKRSEMQSNFYQVDTATFSKNSINEGNVKNSSFMNTIKKQANQLIKRFTLGSMAMITTVAVSADTIVPDTAKIIQQTSKIEMESNLNPQKTQTPIYVGIVYPMGMYWVNSQDYTFNFALSLLTGSVGGINGIQVGGIYNQVNGDVLGVQMGGLLNVVGNMKGIQVGGLSNFTKEMKGIQVGGIINKSTHTDGIQVGGIVNASDNVKGIQVGGIVNVSEDMKGIQVGGIVNVSEDTKGIQVAGIINTSDNFEGVQVAGIINTADDFKGIQLSGIYNDAESVDGLQVSFVNKAKKFKGLQIGFVNIIDTMEKGLAFGLINIVKNRPYYELEAMYSIPNSIKINFRFGTPLFHTVVGVGTNLQADFVHWNPEITIGYGNQVNIFPNFVWQSEILYTNALFGGWELGKTSLSTGFAYFIGGKLGLKAKVGLFHVNNYISDTYYQEENVFFHDDGGSWGEFGVTLDLGISVKF